MGKDLELLAVIVASLSIVSMNFTIMQANKEVIRRLALNLKKIDAAKNLLKITRANMNDIEKFLAIKLGYEIRGSVKDLDDQLHRDYENEDTGF